MAKIKGNFLYRIKGYFIDHMGKQEFDDLLQSCAVQTQDAFSKIIASGDWYDLTAFENFISEFDKKYGRAELQDLAFYLSDKMIYGFFGINVKFTSTANLLSQMQHIWEKAFSDGHIDVIENTDMEIKFKISGLALTESLIYVLEKYFQKWLEMTSQKHWYSTNEKINSSITIIRFEYST